MTENTGIIYLQKDNFYFYSASVGKVIEFRFVPEIIKDLDVINSELLESLIKIFIQSNKIQMCDLIIVFADSASFVKDFISSVPQPVVPVINNAVSVPNVVYSATNDEVKYFIEHVPFDEVASEVFILTNGVKAWATNKELYTSIAKAFEIQGFEIKGVLPGVVFEGSISSKVILDQIMVNYILQNFDSVREHSLLTQVPEGIAVKQNLSGESLKKNEKIEEVVEINDKPKGGVSKKRLFLLVGIFVILIIILIVVYISSKQSS